MNDSSSEDDQFADELLTIDDGETARSRVMPARKTVGRPKKHPTKTKTTNPPGSRRRKPKTETDDLVLID